MSTGNPEFMITEEEGAKLEEALNSVLAEYSVILSSKNAAWANLMMCLIGIYGVRVFALIQRKRQEARIRDEQEKRPPVMTQSVDSSISDERSRAEEMARMSHADSTGTI